MVNNTLSDLNSINTKVTTRTTSWLDMAMRAWGSEWNSPDHAVYRFSNGRNFDSTDKGLTGIYGVDVPFSLEADNNWPDVDGTLQASSADDLLYKD